MSSTRRRLCIVYGVIALLALVGTWSQNVAYFRADEGAAVGFVLATVRFWSDTFATPASTSITIDLILFFVAPPCSWCSKHGSSASAGCGPTSCSAS
jgi:hypothetical protein